MRIKRSLCLGATLALCLGLVACSQSQVTVTLDIAVTVADTLVGALETTGTIPPPVAALIEDFTTKFSNDAAFAITEFGSSDSTALKFSKVIAQFADICPAGAGAQCVGPVLPSGIPSTIGIIIEQLAKAITNFLATMPATTTAIVAQPGGTRAINSSGVKAIQLTRGDKQALPKIAAKNAVLKAKLDALKKK
jgi:hypothetical protein